MNGLPSEKHCINSFVDYNRIGTINLSNQHTENVKQKENPKNGVKFKTPTIENPYSILTDESEDDKSRVIDDGTLDHISSNNFRSGNEQYLIPDTGATTTCVTINAKLKN